MLLSDREIRKAIESGDLSIYPQLSENSGQFQPASVDLRLDDTIWVVQDSPRVSNIPTLDEFSFERYLAEFATEANISTIGGFRLMPGDFVIGRTYETVGLSNLLSGRVEGRSRLARLGVGVHVTAPKMTPGLTTKSRWRFST